MTRIIKKRPFYGTTSTDLSSYEAPHRKMSRRAASEGIVLLKNEKQTLPLAAGSRVALYGAGARHMVKGGTGSGDVNEREVVNIYQGLVDLSFVDEYENIYSILQLVQPGMEGGNALADVISGQVTPGGKMTDTWALDYMDFPNAETYSHNNGDVTKEKYEEGIYVGYRYFDSFEIPVKYSFGHGLSYTDFQIELVNITAGADVDATIKVTNIGARYSGKEVVQVYITAPTGRLEKEYRRLCGFAKTSNLSPGESETVKISFPAYRMASYDERKAEWILEGGIYGVWIGSSLSESRMEALFILDEEKALVKVKNICPLSEELHEICVNAV